MLRSRPPVYAMSQTDRLFIATLPATREQPAASGMARSIKGELCRTVRDEHFQVGMVAWSCASPPLAASRDIFFH